MKISAGGWRFVYFSFSQEQNFQETRVESKDDRQIRIQRETIGMFCDLFNKRLNSLPVPSHMLAFLKHANGYV